MVRLCFNVRFRLVIAHWLERLGFSSTVITYSMGLQLGEWQLAEAEGGLCLI